MDNFGRTPLYIAFERVPLTNTDLREEMVKLLLAYGADSLKTAAHLGSPLSRANFLENGEISHHEEHGLRELRCGSP